MRVVVALGGNALLRRGQPMTEQNQQENVKVAAKALDCTGLRARLSRWIPSGSNGLKQWVYILPSEP